MKARRQFEIDEQRKEQLESQLAAAKSDADKAEEEYEALKKEIEELQKQVDATDDA